MSFSPRLGPFYEKHGAEIVPSGFEEAMDRMADTIGDFRVSSNLTSLPREVSIGHYDLTRYIQTEWDRLTNDIEPDTDFPRRGFLLSSRSASHAAGRAAEEIVLEQLLTHCEVDGERATSVLWFYDALDSGVIIKPAGTCSDDYLVKLASSQYLLVESKASFVRAPDSYVTKAAKQIAATCAVNPCVTYAALALTDLKRKTIRLGAIHVDHPVADLESQLRAVLAGL